MMISPSSSASSTQTNSSDPQALLAHYYGYTAFRGEQERVIRHVHSGKDAIVLMPTGGGKSICYQIPALMKPGLALIISPLISLMKDQVDALNANGIPAAYLNSTQSLSEQRFISSEVENGRIKLLYVAPERLQNGDTAFIDFLKRAELHLVAIDEAHCVSQWGHDFRPDYLNIGKLRQHFQSIPFIALTATADKMTRKDIAEKLGLQKATWFTTSFDRKNITYHVRSKSDWEEQLRDFLLDKQKSSGIIYCLSRKNVEDTAELVRSWGFQALPYHAGLPKEQREYHQQAFIKDEVPIIVATVAFGMGIDKPNVRYVVHVSMPQNIEGYYQETGRAGRDGLPSEALLFYGVSDVIILEKILNNGENAAFNATMQQKLQKMKGFCLSNTCRRRYLLGYFGEELREDCGNCDRCFAKSRLEDVTVPAQMLLSAIVRTGQQYGLQHPILVLRGSKSAKITEAQRGLSLYGIGKDKPEQFWRSLGERLQVEGYLAEAGQAFPLLKLTEKAWEKLKRKEKIMLPISGEALRDAVRDSQSSTKAEIHEELLDELKILRVRLADDYQVPPYVIFGDNTLQEMATLLPQSTPSLLRITGVGEVKAEKYGARFLALICRYAEKHQLPEKRQHLKAKNTGASSGKGASAKGASSGTVLATLQQYKKTRNLYKTASERNLSLKTVEGHLVTAVQEGLLEESEFVSKDDVLSIRLQARRENSRRLTPLKEHFQERFSYFQLKIALANEG